ncbi:hypothetical protein BLS_006991 [Venturia inaequalis]|uniref:Uncharacterized protein n=1 Tax=Venturia inaequalis TaxID=5025 RepID=A0A8H3V654_VENIN|nr:hypothetical protein BLS_006991 [Venturia inaequalis]
MADSSKQPDTTELVKQLLERLAISSAREDQAATITALQTVSSEQQRAVERLRADQDGITTQHASLQDHNDRRFKDVFNQLLVIQTLKERIADLEREKDELKAFVSTVQNDVRNLKLQVAAQDGLRVYHKDFLHDNEDAMSTDLDADIEPEMPPSDPDVSMTLPGFVTPKHLTGHGATTPGTVRTMMPDTAGLKRYDGPFVPFDESSEHHEENVPKRPKRARRQSVAPLETITLSPITEDNELPELKPVTGVDKTLWRESWQQSGKPGTLEDYARKQKMATLFSDITDSKERSRKRYTASDFDKLPAPEEKKRKRAFHQPNTAQPLTAADLYASKLSATTSMPPPSSSKTSRPSRTSKIPGRFGGKDILTGQAFLAATKSRSTLSFSEAGNQAANPPQKSVDADGDDHEEPYTSGRAASSLLQQFGSRKTKVSKNATK